MHFKDDSVSDMRANNYLIVWRLKPLPGSSKFGSVFWSRLFRRGPVDYNYKESRQFIDKTTHRHGFWRQFIDTIEDNSSTLFEDNSSTHLFEYNLQS